MKNRFAPGLILEKFSSQGLTYLIVFTYGIESWGRIAWLLLNLGYANMLVSILVLNGLSIRLSKSRKLFHSLYIISSYLLVLILALALVVFTSLAGLIDSLSTILLCGIYFFFICSKSILDTFFRAVGHVSLFRLYYNINAIATLTGFFLFYKGSNGILNNLGPTNIVLAILSLAELAPILFFFLYYKQSFHRVRSRLIYSLRYFKKIIFYFVYRSYSCALPSLSNLTRNYLFYLIIQTYLGMSGFGSFRILTSLVMPLQILSSSFFAKNIRLFPVASNHLALDSETSSSLFRLDTHYKDHFFRLLILSVTSMPLLFLALHIYKIPQYFYLALPAFITMIIIPFSYQYVLNFNRCIALNPAGRQSFHFIFCSLFPLIPLLVPFVYKSVPLLTLFALYSLSFILAIFLNKNLLRDSDSFIKLTYTSFIRKPLASSVCLLGLLVLYSMFITNSIPVS